MVSRDWLVWGVGIVLIAILILLSIISGTVVITVDYYDDDTQQISSEAVSELKAEIVELRKELNLHDARLKQHNKDALYWKAD